MNGLVYLTGCLVLFVDGFWPDEEFLSDARLYKQARNKGISNVQKGIKLSGNHYTGITVGISDHVKEDWNLVANLNELLTSFSVNLFKETANRIYVGDVNIIVPKTWSEPRTDDLKRRLKYIGEINRVNFETMPIRIYESKSKVMIAPRTVKGTPCGEEGHYIRVPANFLRNSAFMKGFSEPGKTLFYEWAKYKWGVFISETEEKCSVVEQIYVDDNGNSCEQKKNQTNCRYKILETQSDQCKFCRGKSVWDIVQQHSDFKLTSSFLPSNMSQIRPTIKVYKQAPRRIVLALDASTSMLVGGRLEMVRQAAKRFIYAVSSGTYIGLVSFNKLSAVRHELKLIHDEDSRNIISSRLPEDDLTDEGTSIGGAVTIAIEILQNSGPESLRDLGGGEIIVLSDGHESHSPSVSEKMNLIRFYGVTVNTISLGNSDTNILDILSAETQGTPQYSLVQPEEALVSLTDSFFSQLSLSEGEAVPIKNEQFSIPSNSMRYFSFSIDSTVGKDTFIQINFRTVENRSVPFI